MNSKVQVLVAAMNQEDYSLLDKLNIQSDAIVGNQCQRNEITNFSWNGYDITYLNFNERGVGLNRNNSLMRASGDICLFADDDIQYVDNYPEIVEKCFAENPLADVIVFNIVESVPRRYIIKKKHKVGPFNFLRYGAVRIAVKRQKIIEQGVSFNLCFGGGTQHSCGEDSLFLADCLKRGLKIIAVPIFIAKLTENRESTWFNGYTDKYFLDKGAFYRILMPRMKNILCFQDAFRYRKKYGRSWLEVYRAMTGKKHHTNQ